MPDTTLRSFTAHDGSNLAVMDWPLPSGTPTRGLVVIVHGLGGSDAATYTLSTSEHAWARGFHVVRVNMRGAGDGEKLCPRLYNAGLDGDLIAALHAVAARTPRLANAPR